jgi:hypothetical protein
VEKKFKELHEAIQENNVQTFLELIKKITHKDEDDFYEKKTLLIHAIYKNQEEMIKKLLECGFDPNIKSECGYTPLMWAVCNKRVESHTLELLLNFGADINLLSDSKEDCLYFASPDIIDNKWEDFEREKFIFLIENGCNADRILEKLRIRFEGLDDTEIFDLIYHKAAFQNENNRMKVKALRLENLFTSKKISGE